MKQSRSAGKNQNWKISFAKSIEKSKKENVEARKAVDELNHRMFRIEQALIERALNIKN